MGLPRLGCRTDYHSHVNPSLEQLIELSDIYRREVVILHGATVRVLDSQSELSKRISDACTLVNDALGCMQHCLAELQTVSKNAASIRSLESKMPELQQCPKQLVKHHSDSLTREEKMVHQQKVASQERERLAETERLLEERMNQRFKDKVLQQEIVCAVVERERQFKEQLNKLFQEKERILQKETDCALAEMRSVHEAILKHHLSSQQGFIPLSSITEFRQIKRTRVRHSSSHL